MLGVASCMIPHSEMVLNECLYPTEPRLHKISWKLRSLRVVRQVMGIPMFSKDKNLELVARRGE